MKNPLWTRNFSLLIAATTFGCMGLKNWGSIGLRLQEQMQRCFQFHQKQEMTMRNCPQFLPYILYKEWILFSTSLSFRLLPENFHKIFSIFPYFLSFILPVY